MSTRKIYRFAIYWFENQEFVLLVSSESIPSTDDILKIIDMQCERAKNDCRLSFPDEEWAASHSFNQNFNDLITAQRILNILKTMGVVTPDYGNLYDDEEEFYYSLKEATIFKI